MTPTEIIALVVGAAIVAAFFAWAWLTSDGPKPQRRPRS
jgi:hypothetical protein